MLADLLLAVKRPDVYSLTRMVHKVGIRRIIA
jgi:hypothetical protein